MAVGVGVDGEATDGDRRDEDCTRNDYGQPFHPLGLAVHPREPSAV
jgi:hypothetical protein